MPVALNHTWAEACTAAVYLRNRLPHSQLKQRPSFKNQGRTPFEMLYNKKPSISHLQPFGSLCYIHIPEERRSAGSKLQHRAECATFIGYTESPYIYKVQLANKHMFTVQAADCTFVHTNPQLTNSIRSILLIHSLLIQRLLPINRVYCL